MPKWKKGELRWLPEVVSLSKVQLGSRSSEAVVELLSADVDGRRGTEDTVCCWWWCHLGRQKRGNLKSAGTG